MEHFRKYLDEDQTKKVLRVHQRELARFIHAQMQDHHYEDGEVEYDVNIKGFTDLKPSAYNASATDTILDFKHSPADKSNMAKYLFGGFQRCLYPVQKFQSDAERKLAVILERDSLKWFKPAKGQFCIFYKFAGEEHEYLPDFVVETESYTYMLEPKARNELDDAEVKAKAEVAVRWCKMATDYAPEHGWKPWKYALIPHDVIAENMTLQGLVESYSIKET